MVKNKKTIYGILLVCVISILFLSFGLYNHYKIQKQEEINPVITISKEHLQKYVHNAFPNVDFFSMVKKVEVVEGECEANHYWERWDKEGFCGLSTYAKCKTDADCNRGGCSGEVCEGRGEGTATPCVYKDCYSVPNYVCGCINNKCQWHLPKHQCWIVKFYYYGPAEESYLAVYVDKNTNEVIGGTQTR